VLRLSLNWIGRGSKSERIKLKAEERVKEREHKQLLAWERLKLGSGNQDNNFNHARIAYINTFQRANHREC